MSTDYDRQFDDYKRQIQQLEREWEERESQLEEAKESEKESCDRIDDEIADIEYAEEIYYQDRKLMELLEQKKEYLHHAKDAKEKILDAIASERGKLDHQMEDSIDDIRKKMNALERW